MTATFFDDLDDNLDKRRQQREDEFDGEDSETWEPEEGDTLKGVFVQVKYIETRYGIKPLALIKPLKGDTLTEVWCTRMVLRDEMEGLAPKQGTYIGIRYEGQQVSQGGNEFHLYTVNVPEQTEEEEAEGRAYWRHAEANPKMKRARSTRQPSQGASGGSSGQSDLAPF